jgi:hypothetical protein
MDGARITAGKEVGYRHMLKPKGQIFASQIRQVVVVAGAEAVLIRKQSYGAD